MTSAACDLAHDGHRPGARRKRKPKTKTGASRQAEHRIREALGLRVYDITLSEHDVFEAITGRCGFSEEAAVKLGQKEIERVLSELIGRLIKNSDA